MPDNGQRNDTGFALPSLGEKLSENSLQGNIVAMNLKSKNDKVKRRNIRGQAKAIDSNAEASASSPRSIHVKDSQPTSTTSPTLNSDVCFFGALRDLLSASMLNSDQLFGVPVTLDLCESVVVDGDILFLFLRNGEDFG